MALVVKQHVSGLDIAVDITLRWSGEGSEGEERGGTIIIVPSHEGKRIEGMGNMPGGGDIPAP